ncbi:MAG: FdhF/YdeP family oxidoreductase [Pseudomonadota bacterium]
MAKKTVGGGAKKVLYTLQTVQRIGITRAAKALGAKNTCKACALGMGGQLGGMTDEQGTFPSVCNKSIQAQSTDIQPAIPPEIFAHSLDDLRELTPHELEHLGRLATPLHKTAGGAHYQPIVWDDAIALAAERLAQTDPSRSFFYSSGRSSNEAGFVFQLLARLYGTNNVNNCSYYCHQATSVALAGTIGTGTATVELDDLDKCDMIVVIGANPASNHPRFIYKLKECRERGGEVIIINPARESGLVKFAAPKSARSMLTGGSDIATCYVQPRVGEDLALFKGIAKALLARASEDRHFIGNHTQGFAAFHADTLATQWPDIVARCGVTQAQIEDLAERYARADSAVFAWGMGMTHHLHGVDNIEYIANLALLRGMLGRPGAGLLPLRGHSNVQGIGTIGVKPVLPDEVFDKLESAFGVSLSRAAGYDTMAAMQAAARGDIDAAVLLGGNLFAANPDRDWAEQALNKIGFKVSLTTTLNLSHINGVDDSEMLVLPVAARDEEWQSTTQESMFNFVRLSDGQITRHATVRPEVTILADLASALLPKCPVDFQTFKEHKSIRQWIAQIVPGMQQLADIDVARKEFHIAQRLMHEPEFKTADGFAHFKVRALPDEHGSEFILTTVRSEGQFNSIVYEEKDSYRNTDTRWCVMIGRDDMRRLGLTRHDTVTLRSATGEMAGLAVFPHDLAAGSLMAYYPEANALTDTRVDPRSRTPAFKSIPVEIIPEVAA